MIKFKEIRLYPTMHHVDVWITEEPSSLNDIFMKRYGMKQSDIDNDPINSDECMLLYTQKESDLNGEKRFVIVLNNNKDAHVVVHEVNHLKWQLSGETGLEINTHSQEWQSYFMDYITEEILKDDYNTQG